MRKIFTLFLLLIPLWMQAQEDDAWNEADSTLTVTLGETSIGPNSPYKSKTIHVIIKAGTEETNIEVNAFNAWPALKTAIIEEGVTSIGNDAFNGCKQLTSITIPSTMETIALRAFFECTLLEKVEIAMPSNITTIGESAFSNCYSLKSITIPDKVTSIETNTFYNCDGLIEVTIPEGVTVIKKYAFDNCSNLEKVTIPSTITVIKSIAFNKCSSLKEIVYNGTNEPHIERDAFTTNNHGGLPQELIVIVPAEYTGTKFGPFGSNQIKGKAFNITFSTTGKGTVTAKVGETDNATFAGSLNEVTLNVQPEEGYQLTSLMVNGGSVTVTEDNTFIMPFGDVTVAATFQKDPWDEETKTLTVILGETTEYSSYKDQAKHLVIKAGTETEIPASAFRVDWKKVEDIRIESGVTAIGDYAFGDCTAKTVDIPESVESIGEGAFYACI